MCSPGRSRTKCSWRDGSVRGAASDGYAYWIGRGWSCLADAGELFDSSAWVAARMEFVALLLVAMLFPVGIWITRSTPEERGLRPDGEVGAETGNTASATTDSRGVAEAVQTKNFWLILLGSTLAIGAIAE